MRVTQGMMVGNFLNNLSNNFRIMDGIQEKLSTGRRINRPSDDPVGLVSSLRLRTGLAESEKYQGNVDDAIGWLNSNDTALGQAVDILHRARELTVRGASDTLPQASRDAIAQEIIQLREQMVQIANTSHDGRFIFGGFRTTQAPYDSAYNYLGDLAANIDYEIGVNIKMTVNITGNAVFSPASLPPGTDVFDVLTGIENDLGTGNSNSLSNTRLGQLDIAIDNLLSLRSEVGAKTNRLELTRSRLEEATLNLSGLLSKTEDIDTAEVITQLQMQENTYRTALAAGARIIQPTLMDFLR